MPCSSYDALFVISCRRICVQITFVLHSHSRTLIPFSAALREWPGESFARELERAIEALPADTLSDCIFARFGVFFREILLACSCGDEPRFLDAYCELTLEIDWHDGSGRFALISDSME